MELTVAWLRRVESTADGRDPKEVVQAMDDFYAAIQGFHAKDMQARGQSPEPARA